MPSNNRDQVKGCIGCTILCSLLGIGFLLIVILVPLSYSYCEYYDYALVQTKTTGTVDVNSVFTRGRYNLGPTKSFLVYQADAHLEKLDDLSVFSAGGTNSSIGLSFKVDVSFTFLLMQDQIGVLHSESASSYRAVIKSRTVEAIRNEASDVAFDQYFSDRASVESTFRTAVESNWLMNPPLHATLDRFHLGRVQIPASVYQRQLESRVQNERNEREDFLQQAELERQQTAVEVNKIDLDRDRVLRTARAEANLLRAKATSEAKQITSAALINGTALLFEAAGIEGQEQMIAFSYVRTLLDRSNLDLEVNYVSDENTIKTTPV